MKTHIWTAAVLTTAMLATGSIAASATALPADDSTSSECQFGEELLHVWLRLPADLKGDLKALKDLEPGERGDAAREIREGALDGEYGPGVQDRAERIRDRRVAIIATMPDELKSDLIELRDAAPTDRKDLAQDIAETALAGGYGEKTQEVAVRIQERVCD